MMRDTRAASFSAVPATPCVIGVKILATQENCGLTAELATAPRQHPLAAPSISRGLRPIGPGAKNLASDGLRCKADGRFKLRAANALSEALLAGKTGGEPARRDCAAAADAPIFAAIPAASASRIAVRQLAGLWATIPALRRRRRRGIIIFSVRFRQAVRRHWTLGNAFRHLGPRAGSICCPTAPPFTTSALHEFNPGPVLKFTFNFDTTGATSAGFCDYACGASCGHRLAPCRDAGRHPISKASASSFQPRPDMG